MSGEALFGAFCVAWLVIGGVLLTVQLFSRLRGIDELRQLQADETAVSAEIEAEIRAAEAETDEVEVEARTLRRMIRICERRLEVSSALHIATVTIPTAASSVTQPKLRARPRFE